MKVFASLTDLAESVNEIIGWYYDHTYVRRNGVLYDEWMTWNTVSRQQIAEHEIPEAATRCVPPIRYPVCADS